MLAPGIFGAGTMIVFSCELLDRNSIPFFTIFVSFFYHVRRGRHSSVGIATRYGLNGPGIESRWGAKFSSPVQTGPGVHLASYTTGTGSLSRG